MVALKINNVAATWVSTDSPWTLIVRDVNYSLVVKFTKLNFDHLSEYSADFTTRVGGLKVRGRYSFIEPVLVVLW